LNQFKVGIILTLDALEQVFKIGSTSAGAVLFDAIALHEV
jgi:hypothetical protein